MSGNLQAVFRHGVFGAVLAMAILWTLGIADDCMADGIQVQVDGRNVFFDGQEPYVNGDCRTMVPLRGPMEAMGARVTWDEAESRATIKKGHSVVVFVVGQPSYMVNGQVYQMDTRAELVNDRVLIPIKYAAEALGASTVWDESRQCVVIYTDPSYIEVPVLDQSVNESGSTDFNVLNNRGIDWEEAHFRLVYSLDGKPKESFECYYKPNMIRIDDEYGIVTIVNKLQGCIYTYEPSSKIALRSGLGDYDWDRMDFAAHLQQHSFGIDAEYRGTENINGISACVYEYSYGNKVAKGWLMADTGLVLNVVEASPTGFKSIEWTYYQIYNVDDSIFELPQDTTIIDVDGYNNR